MAARVPWIRVDFRSPVPVYRQIVDALRTLIVEGQLPPGHVLPAVRRLAIDLGIHFNTVAQAYRILADEGWLELKHGRGATVARRCAPAAPDKPALRGLRQRLRDVLAQMRASGLSRAQVASELRVLAQNLEQ